MRIFQVQAFLPAIGDNAQSPLKGLGSIYTNVEAMTLEEATSKFYAQDMIKLDVSGVTEAIVLVNPRMCPVVAIQDVTAVVEAERAESALLKPEAETIGSQAQPFKLKRVK